MKAEEVHKMKDGELTIEVENLRKRLFELRTQALTEKLENPRELGNIRRDVARLKTEQSKRQKQKQEA